MYCILDVSCSRLSCCINFFILCVRYLCLIGRVYVFYVGHKDKSSLYETLFHCIILSKHHHHHIFGFFKQFPIYRLLLMIPIYLYVYVYIYIYSHVNVNTYFQIRNNRRRKLRLLLAWIIMTYICICTYIFICKYVYVFKFYRTYRRRKSRLLLAWIIMRAKRKYGLRRRLCW
jgi:hypothetical protein